MIDLITSNEMKPNNLEGYSSRQRRGLEEATSQEKISIEGINNNRKAEPIPHYRKAPCEEIAVNGQNNCQIITGRDRPHSLQSGYGGRGDSRSGCMDIVVGRHIPSQGVEGDRGDKIYVDPNFQKDAARIYISQRTDIDTNFNITDGGVGKSLARSGIAIKADAVRVIGREGIKLVTNTEKENSLGGKISKIRGIDLIAGNRGGLQPMVKGKSLINFLKLVQDDISSLAGMVNSLATKQIALDSAISTHTHSVVPDPTSPTTLGTLPSLLLSISCLADSLQITALDMPSHTSAILNSMGASQDYLESGGSKYILSRYNKTN
jgi:hypothetical protein